jgi:hypothetical protein
MAHLGCSMESEREDQLRLVCGTRNQSGVAATLEKAAGTFDSGALAVNGGPKLHIRGGRELHTSPGVVNPMISDN